MCNYPAHAVDIFGDELAGILIILAGVSGLVVQCREFDVIL